MAEPKRVPKEKEIPKAIPILNPQAADHRSKDPLARRGRLVASAPDRVLMPPPAPLPRPTPASIEPPPFSLPERSLKKEGKQAPMTRSLNDSFLSRFSSVPAPAPAEPEPDPPAPDDLDSDRLKMGGRKSFQDLRREKYHSASSSRVGSLSTLSEKTGSPTILSLLSERMSNMSIAEPSGDQKAVAKVQGLQDERRGEEVGGKTPAGDDMFFQMDQEPSEGAGDDDEDYA
jgi:hypothetical protein